MKRILLIVLAALVTAASSISIAISLGDKGDTGPQGPKGENGSSGKSAYELAVENGYTGTLQQWLASLEGEAGSQGSKGDDGEKGDKGDNGITPQLRVNSSSNIWEVSYDNGTSWISLNVSATGPKGDDGDKGDNGVPGVGVTDAYVDEDLHLWIVLSNGTEIDAGYVGVNTTDPDPAPPSPPPSTNTYTVTFVDFDGTVIKEETVVSGGSAIPPEDPERDGYRFDGWDKAYDNITEDITVTAKYQAEVEISFVDYDGTVIYSESVDQGSDFTNVPPSPSRSDYEFTGWSVTDFTSITEDLTVYAQYVRTYRVAFVDYDGTVLKNQNVRTGLSAVAPSNPTREGYTFTGWDIAFDNVTTNLTVTASYEINRYTVTFAMPDGTVITQKTVKHGYLVIAPEVTESYFHLNATNNYYIFGNGYSFTGWSRSLENITEDQTITAVYGKLITGPIVVAERKAITTNQGTDVTVNVYIANGNAPCGISLDMQIAPALLNGGAPTITVSGQQTNTGSEYYESRLNNEGLYEYRWTKNDGIYNDTIVTFTFKINVFENEGEYPIDILDSTYIITSELEKVTPVIIDGSVTVQK